MVPNTLSLAAALDDDRVWRKGPWVRASPPRLDLPDWAAAAIKLLPIWTTTWARCFLAAYQESPKKRHSLQPGSHGTDITMSGPPRPANEPGRTPFPPMLPPQKPPDA